ncbi:ABC transporter ATP-binding protein [Rhodocytophaga aerolata]|uniref:ABC transporter ATP-binding protein n=1 Tax=Rhodocytophaga aerolata TaxID=455078 RepID=A0ABT8R1M1_9BACT|nr:ABC transporter ATP-binding protein [Rhodocytophaga aerolata]MDO1445284.1 ABC transporter ATP-binding protein [Rhodocytophaga aerolata]
MHTSPLITIQAITKSFKGVKAVDNLTLSVGYNEYVALLGPNGAGKTTLVEMIEGLQKPDSGSITIQGKTWQKDAAFLRTIMGISLQETKFTDKMTVSEVLDLFGSFYKLGKKVTRQILQTIRLEEKAKAYVVTLSGGQRQKLALGVAMLNNPQLLLLDEPTTGLDPNARREIWDILMQLKKERGTSMILTTHYMEEAAYLCDRIVIIDKGKILADDTLATLLTSYDPGEVIAFQVSSPLATNSLYEIRGVKDVHWIEEGVKGMLTVESITHTLPVLLNLVESSGNTITSFESRKKTLDDLFRTMTGRSLHE